MSDHGIIISLITITMEVTRVIIILTNHIMTIINTIITVNSVQILIMIHFAIKITIFLDMMVILPIQLTSHTWSPSPHTQLEQQGKVLLFLTYIF